MGIAIWGESEIIFNSSVKLNDKNCNGDPLTILDDTIKKWKILNMKLPWLDLLVKI